MLQLLSFAFWSACYWCTGTGVTGGYHQWSSLFPIKLNHALCAKCVLTCSSTLQICYFFYKNITFGVTLFLFEAYASFSGEPAYNDWVLSLYNVIFTSLPVIALGVLDQDVSARFCLKVYFHHERFTIT